MSIPVYTADISTSKYMNNVKLQLEKHNETKNSIVLAFFKELMKHYELNIKNMSDIKKFDKKKLLSDSEFNEKIIQTNYKNMCCSLDLYKYFPNDKCECGEHEYNMQTDLMYFIRNILKYSEFKLIEHNDETITVKYIDVFRFN